MHYLWVHRRYTTRGYCGFIEETCLKCMSKKRSSTHHSSLEKCILTHQPPPYYGFSPTLAIHSRGLILQHVCPEERQTRRTHGWMQYVCVCCVLSCWAGVLPEGMNPLKLCAVVPVGERTDCLFFSLWPICYHSFLTHYHSIADTLAIRGGYSNNLTCSKNTVP